MGDDCEIAPHRDTKIVNCQLSIVNSQKRPIWQSAPSIPHPAEENKQRDFRVENSRENRYDIGVREDMS